MLATRRMPRALLALLAVGPLAASVLATGSLATAAPAPASSAASAAPWTVRWASQPLAGAPTDGDGYWPSISGDGRAVTFTSQYHLDTDATYSPDGPWSFLRQTGSAAPSRLVVAPGGQVGDGNDVSGCANCYAESDLSADARTAVFVSHSTNLTAADTRGRSQIFRRDLVTGAVTLVSHGSAGRPANAPSDRPQVSANGRKVLYHSSATNLVRGSTTPGWYVYDAVSDRSTPVGPPGALTWYDEPVLSGDGASVAVGTSESLVLSDTGLYNSYVIDVATGAATLVDVTSAGTQLHGSRPSISDDGTKVAFVYAETHPLIVHVAIRDLTTGQTSLVPVPKRFSMSSMQLSGNGSRLVTMTQDKSGSAAAEVRDLSGRVLYRSSPSSGGYGPSVSTDRNGDCIAFSTTAPEVASDLNGGLDVYTACQG